ncbi:hypothetical protein [Nesterenkonia sp. PF2B19]|uniref:hypothetical protein n=1 Tax=Nesterenkonia sp. PF2B19 TaxID=1881858 RepID=UPI000872982E|nr:hypothetical protein [Nesterenkonia sp. PF2B19]OSM42510.1 hypothetical protein BCY76_014055 [Nesterenkonia sp. PF2B19]
MTLEHLAPHRRFIERHIAPRFRSMNSYDQWPGHRGGLMAGARERGMTVSEHGKTAMFFRDGRLVGGLNRFAPSLTGGLAERICLSKTLTKVALREVGAPIPQGVFVTVKQLGAALEHQRAVGFRPLVLKPSDGNAGRGVTTNITTEKQLRTAWAVARKETVNGRLILEDHVSGVDLRTYVVDGELIGAAVRVPAHVVGDGTSEVSALVAQLTIMRASHAYLRSKKLVVDDVVLTAQGLGRDAVPQEGDVVLLNAEPYLGVGGVNVDVTAELHEDLATLSVETAASIPGLHAVGLDLMVPDVTSGEGAFITELNSRANLSMNQWPAYGEGRPVTGRILDAMERLGARDWAGA